MSLKIVGAQRLPASWNRSLFRMARVEIRTESAQRLPASWNRSLHSLVIAFLVGFCAQRLPASWNRSQSPCWAVCFDHILCSTPSGIMESVTPRQRRARAVVIRCSTPSGIMESVTGLDCHDPTVESVLNAFRHHGIGHRGPRGFASSAGHVLNAFRHHGIGHVT